MTPLQDQDGNAVEQITVPLHMFIGHIVVEHDKVTFLDARMEPVVIVDRPTHPGAGLGVEVKR